jgi:hypothetical protein
MSFPLSPTNGQTAVLNGITYSYSSASTLWTRVTGAVSNTIKSTSSTTPPTNPNIGDIWYNTLTDGTYRYTSDGTVSYWLDFTGPTMSTSASVTSQPTFFAYVATGGQSLTGGAQTKISFSNKNWDTAGAFNATASPVTLNGLTVPAYSFCPPIAGYYLLTGMVQLASVVNCSVDFLKNGTFDAANGYRGELASAQGPMGSAIVYLNGTGDYVDMRVYVATTVAVQTQAGANYFQAAYLGTGVGYATAPAYNPTMLTYRLNSDLAGANVATAQKVFGVGVTLESNTLYQFSAEFGIYRTAGGTSHTIGFGFGGTATLNNIEYAFTTNEVTGQFPTLASVQNASIVITAANTTISAVTSVASKSYSIVIFGTVSVNAGGTFIPQYTTSAAPGGAYTTVAGSYMTLTPINSITGTWA